MYNIYAVKGKVNQPSFLDFINLDFTHLDEL